MKKPITEINNNIENIEQPDSPLTIHQSPDSDSDLAISVRNLTKIYKLYDKPKYRLFEAFHPLRKKYHKDFYALNDISFEVKKGETVGIIGKNGSGKSTLLQILTGVLTPTSGEVKVNGRVSALLELGAGFNPQFTGIENVYFQGALMGFTKKEMDEKLDDILAFADIGDFVHQPVRMYSSGMYVRLAFAVAIMVDPDILIVDEALAVGDIRFQVKCFNIFEEFREKGKTFLFVTHSTGDVVRLCKRSIWLNDGSIRRIGVSKSVVEEYHAWMVHDTGIQKSFETSQADNMQLNTGGELIPIHQNAIKTGEGGASIEGIGLFDAHGRMIHSLSESQKVRVVVKFKAVIDIDNLFVGMQIIDNKGTRLLSVGNKTSDNEIIKLKAGESVQFYFSFFLPELSNGDYLIAVGVNDGEFENHIRHQYILDAYSFKFSSTSIYQKQSGIFKIRDSEFIIQKV